MSTDLSLRDLYDHQLRTEAEVADADRVDRIGPLWLGTYRSRGRGFITYESISQDGDLQELVTSALKLFQADPTISEVEWKTRQHDDLPSLLDTLEARGFVLDEAETVMVGTLEAVLAADPGVPAGYRVEQADTPASIREAEEQAGLVFGHSTERIERTITQLVDRLESAPEAFEMWLVRGPEGDVVCSGRIEFVDDTEFASVWGGACKPEHRGLGLYRALTAERARSAMRRGKMYLQSDCTEFSRPILEKAGLTPVTVTIPATWSRN